MLYLSIIISQWWSPYTVFCCTAHAQTTSHHFVFRGETWATPVVYSHSFSHTEWCLQVADWLAPIGSPRDKLVTMWWRVGTAAILDSLGQLLSCTAVLLVVIWSRSGHTELCVSWLDYSQISSPSWSNLSYFYFDPRYTLKIIECYRQVHWL